MGRLLILASCLWLVILASAKADNPLTIYDPMQSPPSALFPGQRAVFLSAQSGKLSALTDSGVVISLEEQGGDGEGVPAGLILFTDSSCPAGWTEVAALAGKTVIGTTVAAGDVGTTGGADSITPSAHAGTAVADHASHTHTYADVIAHTHVVTSQTATTGGATSYEHGTLDTSSAEAEATEVTGSTGVATGTTAGPSATLTHSVTQANAHAAMDNRSAFVRLIPCKKDA